MCEEIHAEVQRAAIVVRKREEAGNLKVAQRQQGTELAVAWNEAGTVLASMTTGTRH